MRDCNYEPQCHNVCLGKLQKFAYAMAGTFIFCGGSSEPKFLNSIEATQRVRAFAYYNLIAIWRSLEK